MSNQTNGWLPQGYKTPESNSGYTTIEDGDNEIRILSKPLIYWLDWQVDPDGSKHPVRKPYSSTEPKPQPIGDPKNLKHAWALIIWNYQTRQIELWELTQQTIKIPIENLANNIKWGSPFAYDITINKTGKDLSTKYSVIPSPKSEVTNKIKQAYKDKPINLNALLTSGNPFEKTNGVMHEPKQAQVKEEVIEVVNEITGDEENSDLPF